jgi:isoleucyl-tRNA synthetase
VDDEVKEATPEVPPLLVLDESGTPVPLVDLREITHTW